MKYLESNLLACQLASNMIFHMTFLKGLDKYAEKKIVSVTLIHMNIWKWRLLDSWSNIYHVFQLTFKLKYREHYLWQNVEHLEHVDPTTIYIIKVFHLHFRELALLQRILLIWTTTLLLKALEESWNFIVTKLTTVC